VGRDVGCSVGRNVGLEVSRAVGRCCVGLSVIKTEMPSPVGRSGALLDGLLDEIGVPDWGASVNVKLIPPVPNIVSEVGTSTELLPVGVWVTGKPVDGLLDGMDAPKEGVSVTVSLVPSVPGTASDVDSPLEVLPVGDGVVGYSVGSLLICVAVIGSLLVDTDGDEPESTIGADPCKE